MHSGSMPVMSGGQDVLGQANYVAICHANRIKFFITHSDHDVWVLGNFLLALLVSVVCLLSDLVP